MSALLEKVQRKGKGGRAPAEDPRLDPSIDPRKARRILANRISAARSKLKQKLLLEGLKVRRLRWLTVDGLWLVRVDPGWWSVAQAVGGSDAGWPRRGLCVICTVHRSR